MKKFIFLILVFFVNSLYASYAIKPIAGNGNSYTNMTDNSTGLSAEFYYPRDLIIDSNGDLLILDTGENGSSGQGSKIRKVELNDTNPVTSIAGSGVNGLTDNANPLLATFSRAYFFDIDTITKDIYINELGTGQIRKFTNGGGVTTLLTDSNSDYGIAVGDNDRIYANGYWHPDVKEYNMTNGALLNTYDLSVVDCNDTGSTDRSEGGLAYYNNAIYTTCMSKLIEVNLTDGNISTILTAASNINYITFDSNGTMYYTFNKQIHSYDLATSSDTLLLDTLVDSGSEYIYGFKVDDSKNIYYTDGTSNGQIFKAYIPVELNLTIQNINLSEYNLTSILVYGVNENLLMANDTNISDGENNYSGLFSPDTNFSIEFNATIHDINTPWYYNFSNSKFYLENNKSSDFVVEINSTNNNYFLIDVNSSNLVYPYSLDVNVTNINLIEHNISNIQLIGNDLNFENFSISNSFVNGDNNFTTKIINVDANFSVRVDVNSGGSIEYWWYNFSDGNIYRENNGSSDFKTLITSANPNVIVDLLSTKWQNYSPSIAIGVSYTLSSNNAYWSAVANESGELYLSGRNSDHYTLKVSNTGKLLWEDDTHGGDAYSIATDGINGYSIGWGGPIKKYNSSSTPLLDSSSVGFGYYIVANSSGEVFFVQNNGVKALLSDLVTQKWIMTTDLSDSISSHIVYGNDGFIYFVGVDNSYRNQGFVYKLYESNGSVAWKGNFTTTSNAQDAKIALTTDYVFVSAGSEATFKFSRIDGTLIKSFGYISNISGYNNYIYGNYSGSNKKFDTNFNEIENLSFTDNLIDVSKQGILTTSGSGTGATLTLYRNSEYDLELLKNSSAYNLSFILSDLEGDDLNISIDTNDTSLITLTPNWTNPVNSTTYASPLNLDITPVANVEGVALIELNATDGNSTISYSVKVNVTSNLDSYINLSNVTLSENNVTSIRLYGVDGNSEDLFVYKENEIRTIVDGSNVYIVPIYNFDNNFSMEVNVSKYGIDTNWSYNFNDGKLYLDNNGSDEFKREINATDNSFSINLTTTNWNYYHFSGNLLSNDMNVTDLILGDITNNIEYEYNLSSDTFDISFIKLGDYNLTLVTDSNKSWYYNFTTGEINSTRMDSNITLNDSNLSADINVSKLLFDDYISPIPSIVQSGEDYNISEDVLQSGDLTIEANSSVNMNGYQLIVEGDLNLYGEINGSSNIIVKGDTYLWLGEFSDSSITNLTLNGNLTFSQISGDSTFYHPSISNLYINGTSTQNIYMNLPWTISFNSMEFNNSSGVNFYLNNLGTITYSYYKGLEIYGSFIQNTTPINFYNNGILVSNTPKLSYLDYSPSYTYQFLTNPYIDKLYMDYTEFVDFNFSANEIFLSYSYDINESGEINSSLPSVDNLITAESTYNSVKYSLSITSNSNYELNLTKLPNYDIDYISFNNLKGSIKDLTTTINSIRFYNANEINITNSNFTLGYMNLDNYSKVNFINSEVDINGSLNMYDSNLTLINSDLFAKYLYLSGDSNYTKDSTSNFSFAYSDMNLVSDVISLNINANKNSLDFGSIEVGSSATQSVIVTNLDSYGGSVNFSVNSNAFSLNQSSCNLVANGSCEVIITFNPSSDGSYNNTLTLTSGENITNVTLSANSYTTYYPSTTTTEPTTEPTTDVPTTISDGTTTEFINNIDINFNIDTPVSLSDGGDLGDLGTVSESTDGTKTFDIKYDTGSTTEVKASIDVSKDGTSNSKISITDESGNAIETTVELPKGTETTLAKDGSIEQSLKTEAGVETKVKTSPKGEVDVKFKSADGKNIGLKAPAGAKTTVNEDGSLSQNLDTKEVKAEIKASADGKTEVKMENSDGDSVGLDLAVEAETELKSDGSIVQKMTSADGKSTELQASKRAEVKAVIESPTGESLQLNPPKGATVKVNADNSISITNQAMTNDGFVNSQMKANPDGSSSVDVTIDSNQRGVAPKKLTYSTRKDISNAKLEVILDERTELSRTLKTTNSKGGRVKATFSTRKTFSYKSSNLRAIEGFNVDITPENDAKFEENLYFNEKSELKLNSGKANIKAVFSTRSSFNRAKVSTDKLQSTRRSFSIKADKSSIENSGKVTASLSEQETTTTISADSEDLQASIFTLNKNTRDVRGKVTGKKLIYSVRKSFSDVKLEVIEDSNLRSQKAKLKATYSTRSAFSFKSTNLRENIEVIVIPSEDANFTEEINKDGTRLLTLTSGSATINDKDMILNTPYVLPPLQEIETSESLNLKQDVTLKLTKGWNLISSPIAENISDKFIFGNYDVIWNYKNSKWYKNPNMIYYNEGLWIKSNESQDVNFTGESFIPNLKVIPTKWALVGVGEKIEDIPNFLNENRIREIHLYRDNNWTNSDNTQTIELGEGFWIEKQEPNYLLTLIKGWNLASLPTNEIVSDMSIFGDYNDIMIYENGGWIKNPESLNPMQGFWIDMNENLKIAFYGDSYKLDSSLLGDNWSLVGGLIDNLNENDKVWLFKNSQWIEIDSNKLNLIQVGDGVWIGK